MFRTKLILFLILLLSAGCASMSGFDQHAYIQTTSLKVDALNLMNSAVEDYYLHAAEVQSVNILLDKAYEYERNRKNNAITLQLWDKLRDTSGHLYGGFINRWKRESSLNPVFIGESRRQVAEAFDKIAQLESRKIKPKQLR